MNPWKEALLDDMNDWFGQAWEESPNEPPAHLWFIFNDAGIKPESIGFLMQADGDPMVASSLLHAATEQLEYASAAQLNVYVEARHLWVRSNSI